MHQTHLTSFLVYNYMKERQITHLHHHTFFPNKRLHIKMQYEEYFPDKSSVITRMTQKYIKPDQQQKTNLRRKSQLKKAYNQVMETSAPQASHQHLNSNKFSISSDKNLLRPKNNSKISSDYNSSHFAKIPQKKAFWNLETKIPKKSKFYYNTKFGLDIKSIHQLSFNEQRNSRGMRNFSNKHKKKNKFTLDAIQSFSPDHKGKETDVDRCITQKSLKNMAKTTKIFTISKQRKFTMKKNKDKKNEDQRSLQSRMQRMFNFMSIVLYSFCCFIKTPQIQTLLKVSQQSKIKKRSQKFSYYVGKGNNKNLIVSIMKKRWWWIETDDINSANFVWTQLKIQSIQQKQTSMSYSQLQTPNPQTIQSQQKLKQTLKKEPINRIFHQKINKKFHKKLNLEQQKVILRELKSPKITHNHYEANYMLGNKKALFYNLARYYGFLNKCVWDLIPMTFHIQKINSKSWKLFQNEVKQSNNSLWIIKPGQNSNRGKGIFIEKQLSKIKKRLQCKKNQLHSYIIQKYIKNLFLFQKRKFDIRTYMLVITIGGVMKCFWYNEGYLRTSSQFFDSNNLYDLYIHLTNDAVQVKSEQYGKYQQGNKISYHQFQRYLDNNYPNQKYLVSSLNQKMRLIATEIIKSTYLKLDPSNKEYSFQIFGLDFIVDCNFKPWLLQVNTNPCLELSSSCLQRLIPRMIQNAFRIAIDPMFQPSIECPRSYTSYIPDNMIENNRFQLIFDTLFDRNYEWQIFSSSIVQNVKYEDEDQEFDGDGEIIAFED